MTSPALTNIPDRSPDEARAERQRKDMVGWFGARHASDGYGILSRNGREVCRCDYESDRDALLQAARAHHALVEALEHVVRFHDQLTSEDIRMVEAALALARKGGGE